MSKVLLLICLVNVFVIFTTPAYCLSGETDVTITLPEEVGEALDRVGVHIETPQEKRESSWMLAAIIGGGIIMAGLIIALILKRRE